eukprot:TRINITY_DN9489_c0_g1_i11.p1 TRINITY_DN9489_c0_g1~~TRINITY_DN9489_c0_g1_i11.p1  ORF type:complete len:163 (-),score=48.79 TRINITY_DN9489_c0_g1_i11:146-634(-)
MQIFVRLPGGKMVTVDFALEMTVAELKKRIEEKQGISSAEQTLTSKGKVLRDSDTLAAAGLNVEDTIYLSSEKVEVSEVKKDGSVKVSVTEKSGNSFIMEFVETESIVLMKQKIFEKIEGSPAAKEIIHNGMLLKNTETIRSSNIKSGSNLIVVSSVPGGVC